MVRYAAFPDEPVTDAGPDGPKIWSRNLLAFYETDPDIVAAVLPQPLEPTEPHVRVNFAQVEMESGPLGGCTFSVKCRHGDVEGIYDLLMIMTVEGAVLGGRETFGEPKKVGDASIRHENGEVSAVASRKGVDIIEIRGRVAETLAPEPLTERFAFYYKFLLDPAGGRFEADPTLVHVRRTQEDRLRERVEGEIVLRESPFDPVVDLPVRNLLSIVYTESNQTQTGEIVGTVPSAWVWPFRHQRYDGMIARLQPTASR